MSDCEDVSESGKPDTLGVAPTPGVIAVIGCDGSGKSTLSRWLARELGQQRESQFVYFGTGNGPGSRLIKMLNWLKERSRFGRKSMPASDAWNNSIADETSTRPGTESTPASVHQKNKVPDLLRMVWAFAALQDKRAKMHELDRCVSSGMIVVTDRYPQAEFWGVHDGPRLGYLLDGGSSGILHRIAMWEQSSYVDMVQRKPDLVILLDVSVEVAHARRPEEPVDVLTRRIKVAQSLRFQDAARAVLDADEPLEMVQHNALSAAVSSLAGGSVPDEQKELDDAGPDGKHTINSDTIVNVRSM